MTAFYRIVAPHFVAAIEVEHDYVQHTAPILAWMRGKHWEVCRNWCERKGYTVEVIQ